MHTKLREMCCVKRERFLHKQTHDQHFNQKAQLAARKISFSPPKKAVARKLLNSYSGNYGKGRKKLHVWQMKQLQRAKTNKTQFSLPISFNKGNIALCGVQARKTNSNFSETWCWPSENVPTRTYWFVLMSHIFTHCMFWRSVEYHGTITQLSLFFHARIIYLQTAYNWYCFMISTKLQKSVCYD